MSRTLKRWIYPLLLGAGLGFVMLSGAISPVQAAAPAAVLKEEAGAHPKARMAARVAIIIDDVGYLKRPAEELLQVPAHLTFSVLPFTPYAKEFALAAHKKGFDVMLHLPMPTLRGKRAIGPGMIAKDWPESEIIRQLDADFAAVPGLEGVNNHMGTAGPRDRGYMTAILKELKRRGLFYVDSLTGCSVAEECARLERVPFAKRDVFIDHFRKLDDNESSIRQLIQIALKKGSAIGIGHPREGTATEIRAMLPAFQKAGVEIVSVAKLVQ